MPVNQDILPNMLWLWKNIDNKGSNIFKEHVIINYLPHVDNFVRNFKSNFSQQHFRQPQNSSLVYKITENSKKKNKKFNILVCP